MTKPKKKDEHDRRNPWSMQAERLGCPGCKTSNAKRRPFGASCNFRGVVRVDAKTGKCLCRVAG